MTTWPYRVAREQRAIRMLIVSVGVVLIATACSDDYDDDDYTPTEPPPPAATVVSATGAITTKVDEFRALLGEPRNGATVPGPTQTGRREVNWDGVSGANVNTNTFPTDFFNTTTKLGLITKTPGVGLRVSDNDFSDVSAAFGEAFNPFSGTKTFAAIGSPTLDVTFQVAAGTAAATVSGFGVVFTDVDSATSTRLEVFDKSGKKLGTFPVPARSDASGFSFVGVKFASAVIARVRITAGGGALGAQAQDVSNGGKTDLVAMDDFLYSEPVPE